MTLFDVDKTSLHSEICHSWGNLLLFKNFTVYRSEQDVRIGDGARHLVEPRKGEVMSVAKNLGVFKPASTRDLNVACKLLRVVGVPEIVDDVQNLL